ncbi:hypothetical protein K504DRAFT_79602 [Pleomassaria siparia CBS 279.74]|uniref:Uncharacterized protein n=1 Tax=Pleomassaria siparia CBS 279.74 TaxID=1314801 RepID=A0A6G1K0I4_9PLEO|nr:hypothetical protein K504DRAFT_79602 [Pleomassaria siparia CBS 279.74]
MAYPLHAPCIVLRYIACSTWTSISASPFTTTTTTTFFFLLVVLCVNMHTVSMETIPDTFSFRVSSLRMEETDRREDQECLLERQSLWGPDCLATSS